MKCQSCRLLLIFALALPTLSLAQQEAKSVAPPPPEQRGKSFEAGDIQTRITSIFIPPKKDAAFLLSLRTDLVGIPGEGEREMRYNYRTIARDRFGRIYQERRSFVRVGGKAEPQVLRMEISDPAAHEKLFCTPANQVCEVENYFAAESRVAAIHGQEPGSQDLGSRDLLGVEVQGTREIRKTDEGQESVETWYSPRLGLDMLVNKMSPRYGVRNFTVEKLELNDPDARLFSVPEGYRVVDLRPGKN